MHCHRYFLVSTNMHQVTSKLHLCYKFISRQVRSYDICYRRHKMLVDINATRFRNLQFPVTDIHLSDIIA